VIGDLLKAEGNNFQIGLQATDKSQYFSKTKFNFNNCFIIYLAIFEILWPSRSLQKSLFTFRNSKY
jgi:hypothetical protein